MAWHPFVAKGKKTEFEVEVADGGTANLKRSSSKTKIKLVCKCEVQPRAEDHPLPFAFKSDTSGPCLAFRLPSR